VPIFITFVYFFYTEKYLWPYKTHNYFFEKTALTWHDASNRCIARGGNLVTFNDDLEWTLFKSHAVNRFSQILSRSKFK